MQPPASYEGLRVVVTGGAGFVGHHLVRRLVESGAEVLVLDDLSTGSADRLKSGVELIRLDISTDSIAPVLRSWAASTVFHLAAQASVPRGEAEPELDLKVNGLGTLRLLLAAQDAGTDRFVFTSSGGAVYGESSQPATESSPVVPSSVYGIHKLLGERYTNRSLVSHAIARPSNVYGPGQDANGEGAVVAAFTDAARLGRGLTIHGDGLQERDFLHADDLVDALLLLGASREIGTWNVSVGQSTTIEQLADLVQRISGRPMPISHGESRAGDVRLSRLSSAKLGRLGWVPTNNLEDALRKLIFRES